MKQQRYEDWIGSTERLEEDLALTSVQGLAATLDDATSRFAAGDALPPLWHWLYFLPGVAVGSRPRWSSAPGRFFAAGGVAAKDVCWRSHPIPFSAASG